MSAPETLKEPEALREEVRPLPPAEAAPAADGTLPPLPEAFAVLKGAYCRHKRPCKENKIEQHPKNLLF